ncbi:MAG: wax ester/triacylglycerol synthase family O-acyltransferase [Pseudomonadales bacterium]|nr:wax ester/triacylglycerol synthase family O-acyltransferase [Pseudomonadales bacterium]
MQRTLSALDMAFLGLEQYKSPMNVGSLQIYEYPVGKGKSYVRDLYQRLIKMPASAPFTLKLKKRRLLRFAQWVEDTEFDLEYHVRHASLPCPGDDESLYNLVTRIHSHIMDRERPLWEYYLIEGLSGNRFAIYVKMHHTMIDGTRGMALIDKLLANTPDQTLNSLWQGQLQLKTDEVKGSSGLSQLRTIQKSIYNSAGTISGLVKLSLVQVDKMLSADSSFAPAPFTSPLSLFNHPIKNARRLSVRSYPLDEVKNIGRNSGSTVNDVIICACSGALRKYLLERQSLPANSLIATVPVTVEKKEQTGNYISYVTATLATNEPEIASRLEKITKSTQKAKREIHSVSPKSSMMFAFLAQGLIASLQKLGLSWLLPQPANLVISNVPGSKNTKYFDGAKLLSHIPVTLLFDGQGINITVISYHNRLEISLLTCRDSVPEANKIAIYLDDAMQELANKFRVS